MKKLKYLFLIMVTTFMSVSLVKADTLTFESISGYDIYIENEEIFEEQANRLIDYYNTNLKEKYRYYIITYGSPDGLHPGLYMAVSSSVSFSVSEQSGSNEAFYSFNLFTDLSFSFDDNNTITSLPLSGSLNILFRFNSDSIALGNFKFIYDSNFPILYNKNLITQHNDFSHLSIDTLEIKNFYSDTSIIINHNENIPLLKDLLKYDSFTDFVANQKGYTEVNLDDYEYVILNLKDYSKKEAFETNLQVKGSVGITPLYNYGQAEKSVVTDRCNLSYSDFTNYRFFILKNDLTNNAFYIVKACEENSSFRFDSTLFDITYVTTENVDDPVVTFGGIEYHTIPFNKLSNSANQNEQNNFIPGESGSSLTDIINNISDFTSDIWNAVSSFMGLVTKFFNTLPEEFRYLSITSFTVLTVIAIIKFIRG